MAESSKQEQTPPHQSYVQQDQLEEPRTPIPLDPTTQVDFNLDEITIKANNEDRVEQLKLQAPLRRVYFLLGRGCQWLKSSSTYGARLLKKKNTEKVIPYPMFLSLLLEHKMKGYGTDEVNFNPTQIFIELVAFQAPRTSSYSKKKDSQGKQPGAKTGRRKKSTSLTTKHNPLSKIEATKGEPSSKEEIKSPPHSKKRKQSGTAKDPNPSQPPTSTHVVDGMHKEVQEATSGPTSLGVNGTNPNVLVDKTKSAGDGLETIHTKTGTDKEASRAEKEAIFDQDEFNTSPKLTRYEDAKEIKIKDLSKLVKDVGIDLIDLDSLEDDTPFIAEDDEDEEVHAKLIALPGQVSFITAQLSKLKVMDALPILLIKATEALNRFATVIASTSQKMVILVFIQQAKLALILLGGEEHTTIYNHSVIPMKNYKRCNKGKHEQRTNTNNNT
ncbi:hypothetical protein Tco_0916112 [Tanacetum coccineum]